jgi:hypothetical protein
MEAIYPPPEETWSGVLRTGVCRSRNALLNGDTSNYDWDSGYTCHQLGSGAIMVQLGGDKEVIKEQPTPTNLSATARRVLQCTRSQ